MASTVAGTFSHLPRELATFTHHFEDGASLTITYRRNVLTPRVLHAINELRQRGQDALTDDEAIELMDATQHLLASVLDGWTATHDDGSPILCTFEGLNDVDYDAQQAVLGWIREHQSPGKSSASASSPVSSTPISESRARASKTSSYHRSRNGTAKRASRAG